MPKLWLTERNYSLIGSLIRIIYWLAAIYISSIYLQEFSEQTWTKIGLMAISILFVIGFLFLTRLLDHFFKTSKN